MTLAATLRFLLPPNIHYARGSDGTIPSAFTEVYCTSVAMG